MEKDSPDFKIGDLVRRTRSRLPNERMKWFREDYRFRIRMVNEHTVIDERGNVHDVFSIELVTRRSREK